VYGSRITIIIVLNQKGPKIGAKTQDTNNNTIIRRTTTKAEVDQWVEDEKKAQLELVAMATGIEGGAVVEDEKETEEQQQQREEEEEATREAANQKTNYGRGGKIASSTKEVNWQKTIRHY